MLRRTAAIANAVCQVSPLEMGNVEHVVATDHADIIAHCAAHNIPAVMTEANLASGSDRALSAAKIMRLNTGREYAHILNLQGDAPFTPPEHVQAVLTALRSSGADCATPYVRLSWDALDRFRADKIDTPFSGTTLTARQDGRALWFSKNIIPALRNETELRLRSETSPICRHIGLYGYTARALAAFVSFAQSSYETLEGLEQLRALENGLSIQTVEVAAPLISSPGIDTPADLRRAEDMIARYGDPFLQIASDTPAPQEPYT